MPTIEKKKINKTCSHLIFFFLIFFYFFYILDSPSDDGRGSSPSRVSSSNLGRRGSYKTSRGEHLAFEKKKKKAQLIFV